MENNSYKRVYYFDLLKILAIFAVILVHVSAPFATSEINSSNYWVGHSVDSIFRFGTTIFVMISGALLLDENYLFSKRKNFYHILRFICCFVVWSLAYVTIYEVIVPAIKGIKIISFEDYVRCFFKGHVHLWYLIMATGLYLVTPLLRLWVKKDNKKYVEYFLLLSLLFYFLITYVFDILKWFDVDLLKIDQFFNYSSMHFVMGYIPIFVLGWYLHNFDLKKQYIIHILALISLAFTIVASWGFSSITGKTILLYNSNYITIVLIASSVFLFFKHFYLNKAPKNKFFIWNIQFVSKHSMGFYAAHVGFCYMMSRILDRNWTNDALIVIPLSCLAGFVLSYLLCWLLSWIPLIRKLV